MSAGRILSNHIGANWSQGRYGIERACTCVKGARSAECHLAGWHLVASSDDRQDAISEAARLRPFGTHRVVDQDDYSEIA